MNTEKIEKLKKTLNSTKLPADLKPKIEAEIKRLEDLDAKNSPQPKEDEKPVAKTRKPRATKSVAKKTSSAKPSQTSKPKRTAMSVAKEIRKDGESWKDAMARASKVMKEKTHTATKDVESELDKLTKFVKGKKELQGQIGQTNLLRDAKRKAKPMGRRVSKDGSVYYENRANRTDRGTFGKYHLAEGGAVDKWIGYDKDHLINMKNGMIVLRATNLKDIKPKDIKGFDMLDNRGYAEGGGVGYSKKERVIDYYYNNDVFDDYETYGLSEDDLNNENKIVKAIIKYHDLDDPKMVKERFNNLGLEEFATGGSINEKTTKMRKQRLKKGDTVTVIGRRWFDRVNGNTYHTAEVEVNGKSIGKSPMTYGYDDYYLETGKGILLEQYDFPRGMTERSPMWQLRDNGVTFSKYVSDGLKRDLAKGGGVRRINGRDYDFGSAWTNDHNQYDKGADHEVEYRKKKKFEIGGTVVTDLAGHTGGSLGGDPTMLDGMSGTAYTGLVGETGAMSSGEMFMAGGSIDTQEKKVIYYRNKLVKMNVGKDEPALNFSIKLIDMLLDEELVSGNEKPKKGTDSERKILSYRDKLVKMNIGKDEPALDFAIRLIDMLLDGKLVVKGNYELGGGLPSGVNQSYMITEALGNPAQHLAKGGGFSEHNGRKYDIGRNWTKDHNEFDKGADHEVEYRRKKSFFAKGGAMENFKYDDVLEVLKEKLEGAIDDLPMEYESSEYFTGEEVEKQSRDGFIAYTDGGYEVNWFESMSMFSGSSNSLPTNPLDNELQRQIDYNYQLAKEIFEENYPEIVRELGEDNIDYNSLYDAGYEDEAEQLSEWEMNNDGDDTILCEIGAYYYDTDNDRGIDGEHTIRLFGYVNLESPYHRRGNLDDSYDIDITFDSISELKEKVDAGLKEIIDWFDGKYYNDSTTEMKIRRMADGGEFMTDPTFGNFQNQVFAKGGGVGTHKYTLSEAKNMLGAEKSKNEGFSWFVSDVDYYGEDDNEQEYGVHLTDKELLDLADEVGDNYAKGGKVSPFKNIMETNTITEKEINLIKLRMNNDKVDEDTQEVIDYIWDNSPQLTPDQNKKGIDYLRNLWKSPTGKERTNNPFGYREQDALETFEYFELRGFYDAGNRYNKFYVPLYTCVGADSSFEYAFYGGKVNILG